MSNLVLTFNSSYTTDPSATIGGIVFDLSTDRKTLTSQSTNVTSIPNYFLAGNAKAGNLVNVTIPNTVTSIGGNAFSYCTILSSVTIPNLVTNIDTDTFFNCNGLSSVTFGPSVTNIGFRAFQRCYGLTSVIFPNSLTVIVGGAFLFCSNLTSVKMGNLVSFIGNNAFGSTALTTVTIPSQNGIGLPVPATNVFFMGKEELIRFFHKALQPLILQYQTRHSVTLPLH